jgi:hypothetical protein
VKRRLLIAGIVVGFLLTFGPLASVFVFGQGMRRAIEMRVDRADPEMVVTHFRRSFRIALTSLIASPVGLLLAGTCIFLLAKHSRKTPPPLNSASRP